MDMGYLGLDEELTIMYALLLIRSSFEAANAQDNEIVVEDVIVPAAVPEGAEDDCPICMEKMKGGEKDVCKLYCKHYFHVECMEKWLETRMECPICRAEQKFASDA